MRLWLVQAPAASEPPFRSGSISLSFGGSGFLSLDSNWQALKKFGWYAFYMTFKMLRRRGQKHPISQEKFGELWNTFVRPLFISKEIWKCEPMPIGRAVCLNRARTVL